MHRVRYQQIMFKRILDYYIIDWYDDHSTTALLELWYKQQ